MIRKLLPLLCALAFIQTPQLAHAQAMQLMCRSASLANGPIVACPIDVPITASNAIVSGGTTFTLGSGGGACATSSTLVGGAAAGSFVCTGTAGASTQVVNLPLAAHGWSCWVADITSGVVGETVAPVSTTAATLKVTVGTTSDVIQFGCLGY